MNIDPTAEDLAEAAILVAALARELRRRAAHRDALLLELRQRPPPAVRKMRRAAEIVRERRPDLAVDGEMQADTAVVPEIVAQRYPFSQVSDANVLVFPSLEAANITYKLLQRIGGAEVDRAGPARDGQVGARAPGRRRRQEHRADGGDGRLRRPDQRRRRREHRGRQLITS